MNAYNAGRRDSGGRFWQHIDTSKGPNRCWLWTGPINNDGYGVWSFVVAGERTSSAAHRLAYEALNGPIPDGLHLHHGCENRACCNPAHLEALTPGEHAAHHWASRTHCPHGHEFTPEEDVIAESTDEHPASRTRVLNEIRSFCRLRGITIPADVATGRARRLDSTRIVEATVVAAEISPELLGAIDYSTLERGSLERWVSSLTVSIRSLTTLRNNLRKELTND